MEARYLAALKSFRADGIDYRPGMGVPSTVYNVDQLVHLGLVVDIPREVILRVVREIMAEGDAQDLHAKALEVAEAEAAALEDAEELAIKSGAAPPPEGATTPARAARARAEQVKAGLERAKSDDPVTGFAHPLAPLGAAPGVEPSTEPESPEEEAERKANNPVPLDAGTAPGQPRPPAPTPQGEKARQKAEAARAEREEAEAKEAAKSPPPPPPAPPKSPPPPPKPASEG